METDLRNLLKNCPVLSDVFGLGADLPLDIRGGNLNKSRLDQSQLFRDDKRLLCLEKKADYEIWEGSQGQFVHPKQSKIYLTFNANV